MSPARKNKTRILNAQHKKCIQKHKQLANAAKSNSWGIVHRMNILSTFLFSGREEIELLLIKLTTESKYVKSWIAVEGIYTFQGEPKRLNLREILEEDPRFTEFSERVEIVEIRENLATKFSYPKGFKFRKVLELSLRRTLGIDFETTLRKYKEMPNFYVERQSRDCALAFILQSINPEQDWVFISDVDEVLNLEVETARRDLKKRMDGKSNFLLLNRMRFVFDFDNLDGQQRFTPLVRVSYLQRYPLLTLAEFRERVDGMPLTEHPYVVEYSYCFSRKGIYEKLKSFAHLSPSLEQIERAFRLNHNFVYTNNGSLNLRWLSKVDISSMQVPQVVKTNFKQLETGNVNPDFVLARADEFPSLFT
jgi:hypothetical protein